MSELTPLYTTSATAHGGRDGRVKVEDSTLELALVMPKQLGGPGGGGANPEQLFAAGYAACFESALRVVARKQKVALTDASITARVSLGKTSDGLFALAVELRGKIEGIERAEAEKLMHAAHQVCPYSAATRGNIEVKLTVE